MIPTGSFRLLSYTALSPSSLFSLLPRLHKSHFLFHCSQPTVVEETHQLLLLTPDRLGSVRWKWYLIALSGKFDSISFGFCKADDCLSHPTVDLPLSKNLYLSKLIGIPSSTNIQPPQKPLCTGTCPVLLPSFPGHYMVNGGRGWRVILTGSCSFLLLHCFLLQWNAYRARVPFKYLSLRIVHWLWSVTPPPLFHCFVPSCFLPWLLSVF